METQIQNQTLTIGVREFVAKYIADENVFIFLPEFSFIEAVAKKWKAQNCGCGLGKEILETTFKFNEIANNAANELANKVALIFGATNICFSIQDRNSHNTKCFN